MPKDEFRADLEMGLGRVAFMNKDWADAEKHFAKIADDHPDSHFAPQAVYYRGVSRYSASHDGAELAATAAALAEKYRDSAWRLRSLPWASE